ncbi:MAG: cation:proton antiporter [Actinomycetota bacterium]
MGAVAVIVAAGLLGPLLAVWKRFPLPVVIGEILAGIIVGPQLLNIVHPDEPVVAALHDAGFALLMFTVGLHLRLHDPAMRRAAPRALVALGATIALALPLAIFISDAAGLGHPGAVAIVLATSSAAIAMPVLTDAAGGDLPGDFVGVAAWIVMADVLTIVALPLVTAQSSVVKVLLASIAVTAIAWLALISLRQLSRSRFWRHMDAASMEKGWSLNLRISLLLLFALAWIGPKLGTSMLVAGFAAGLAVSALGVSGRLTQQILGVGEGFLIPAFFVVLGAAIQPKGLFTTDGLILTGGLVVGTTFVHIVGGAAGGFRPASSLVASAQMGVPLALVTLGQSQGWLNGDDAAAFVVAALLTVGLCAMGARRLGRTLPKHFNPGLPKDLRLADDGSDSLGQA